MTMRERWNRFLEHYPSMGLTSTSDRRLTAVARAWIFRPIYDDQRMFYEKDREAELKARASLKAPILPFSHYV
jgi:hypothetical protein